MGDNEDPALEGERPDLKGKVSIPHVLYQAHSAPITMTFYPQFDAANKPANAFPPEYWGDFFTVMRGSWNRAFRTGHKVVRVRMKDGVPTGEYEDFLVGFITDEGNAWGRLAGSVVAADGSLLITDESSNSILRISYQPGVSVSGDDIWPEGLTSLADGTLIIGSARRAIYRAAPGVEKAQP
jgi:glucose/arabinose dehydrogenase